MPRINVTLPDAKKQRWDKFVNDDPRIDSLSDLVRTAVAEYIDGGNSSGGELNDAVVDEIMGSLDSLESQLGDLESSTNKLHRRTIDADEIEDIVALQTENIPDVITIDLILRNALADIEDVDGDALQKTVETDDYLREMQEIHQEHRRGLNDLEY